MDQRPGIWRSEEGERRWLSLLIDAMEQAARPEIRALPCDGSILETLRAQLAQPVPRYLYAPSAYSLCN